MQARTVVSVALLAAAFVPGLPATAAAQNAGADAYRRVCGECHGDPRVVARRFGSLAAEARTARWEAFLTRHHGGEAEQRALIRQYLEEILSGPR